MAGRRIGYLAVLAACLVYYQFYNAWFSHFLLLVVLGIPLLSVLLSLPAIYSARFSLQLPGQLPMGTPVATQLECQCRLPVPQYRFSLRITHAITGQSSVLKRNAPIPTNHCGTLYIQVSRLRCCDYLGLFSFPRRLSRCRITVLPLKLPYSKVPHLRRYMAHSWMPKAGGGFSENHDLRLYRPGDSLRQIHWKLAAKTGKLIYREPIMPIKQTPVLALKLSGDEDMLDRKLGRLLWTSDFFLNNGLSFTVLCLTGKGLECVCVDNHEDAASLVKKLLSSPAADSSQQLPDDNFFLIGGESDA